MYNYTIPDSPRRIELVDSEREVDRAIRHLHRFDCLGFDVETFHSVDHKIAAFNPEDGARMRLAQFATPKGRAFVFDLYRVKKEFLYRLFPNNFLCVIQNAKFELKFLMYELGLYKYGNLYCTMIAEQVLAKGFVAANSPGYIPVGLDAIADRRLGVSLPKEGQKSDWYKTVLSDDQIEYAARDAQIVLPIMEAQVETLFLQGQIRVAELEFRTVAPVAFMELSGVRMDKEAWVKRCEKKQGEIEVIEKQLWPLLGTQGTLFDSVAPINLSSKQQVMTAFERIGVRIPVDKENKKTLSTKLFEDQKHIPAVKLFCDFVKLDKALSSYGPAWLDKINPYDGRIHTKIKQIGAECVVGSSIVSTTNGFIRIEKIKPKIKTWKPSKCVTAIINRYGNPENTSKLVKYSNRPTIKIKTRLGFELEGTLDHPILASGSGRLRYDQLQENWVELSDLQEGQYVKLLMNYDGFSKTYHGLVQGHISTYGAAKKIKLPLTLDENLGEFLGIYYADGSIKSDNGTFMIRISTYDKSVIKRVTALSKKLFSIVPTYSNGELRITCISLKCLELQLGMGRTCKEKYIPDIILTSPKSVISAFIKGLTLDSNVVVEGSKITHTICFSNRESAYTIQTILLALGVIGSVTHGSGKDKNCSFVSLTNQEYVIFKQKIGFVQPHKVIKHTLSPRGFTTYTVSLDRKELWVRVKEITRSKNDVFDFHVPKTHSFITNGFVSHNTGRMSSPDMLLIPKDDLTRNCFIADPGWVIVDCDFSQCELRILAEYCRDPNLLLAFDNNYDLHTFSAHLIYRVPLDQVTKEQRSVAKNLNFGIVYGIGSRKFANDANITPEEGQKIMSYYLEEAYPQMGHWLDNRARQVLYYMYATTMIGRIRRYTGSLNDKQFKAQVSRNAKNLPIQGSNADITKRAMDLVYSEIIDRGLQTVVKMILVVHDEIVLEARPWIVETAKDIVIRCMLKAEGEFLRRVKCKVDCNVTLRFSKEPTKELLKEAQDLILEYV